MTADLRGHSATSRGLMLPAAALVYLLSSSAQAGPPSVFECGQTISAESGKVTLGADIGPCGSDTDPALTIEGPVKVNFNGHKVICDADINGIEVTGHDALIQNGIVKNCADAIRLIDDDAQDAEVVGRHKIIRMIVRTDQSDVGKRGFRVDSDSNYLALNVALRFNGEGFRVDGKQNRLIRNTATHNQNHGFRVNGDDNTLTANLARRAGSEENGGEGFRVEGNGNRLLNNIALKSQDDGFRIQEGQDNTLIRNVAQGNGLSGPHAGINLEGSSNRLHNNAVLGNTGNGILVSRGDEHPERNATNNSIDRNTARDNGDTDLVDEHETPPCDDNAWTRNRFGTASQDCIQ